MIRLLSSLTAAIALSAAMLVGTSSTAEAGRRGVSVTIVTGHARCGCPIYSNRTFYGYRNCGTPIYRYHRLPVRHRCGHGYHRSRNYSRYDRYDRRYDRRDRYDRRRDRRYDRRRERR